MITLSRAVLSGKVKGRENPYGIMEAESGHQ
jgi:hypothetical protein